MLSQELETSLNAAIQQARLCRHEFITVEHLLSALLDNPSAARVIRACGGEIEQLRQNLNEFIDSNVPVLPEDSDAEVQPGLGFQRVIQRAILHVQGSGTKEVSGANVLVAIFGERDSHAVYFLSKQDVTRFDVVNYISHGISKVSGEGIGLPAPDGEAEIDENSEEASKSPLAVYAVNLNARAAAGQIDPLIGRSEEVERTIQILLVRSGTNTFDIAIGERGFQQVGCVHGATRSRTGANNGMNFVNKQNTVGLFT